MQLVLYCNCTWCCSSIPCSCCSVNVTPTVAAVVVVTVVAALFILQFLQSLRICDFLFRLLVPCLEATSKASQSRAEQSKRGKGEKWCVERGGETPPRIETPKSLPSLLSVLTKCRRRSFPRPRVQARVRVRVVVVVVVARPSSRGRRRRRRPSCSLVCVAPPSTGGPKTHFLRNT